MKKRILAFAFIGAFMGTLAAQTENLAQRANLNSNFRMGIPVTEEKSPPQFSGNPNSLFSNDVIINSAPTVDQRNVKIATAFNGWTYSAFTTSEAGNGGIYIRQSRDGGQTWSDFTYSGGPGLDYTAIDLTVTGSDTLNLSLFIAGVLNNSGNYIVWMDKYNATTGNFIGENFNETSGTNLIYDVSLATDYESPSYLSTPFSVALAYSKDYTMADSLIYAASIDGGNTFTTRIGVLGTGYYLRKISIAYGRSSNWSNGRYFIAFENRINSSMDVGNVGMVYTNSDPTSAFSTPMFLDSIDSGLQGKVRYPKMSLQKDNNLNDSSGLSAIITVDRQYSSLDWDALSIVSEKTVNSSPADWQRLDIDNSSNVAIESDVIYNSANHLFAVSYYDSTAQHLLIATTDYNVTASSNWTSINTQYNDLTTNIIAPKPRLSFNPTDTSIQVVWNSEGSSANGVPLFDAGVLGLSIAANAQNLEFGNLYPNPTAGELNFSFNLKSESNVQLHILNLLGEEVFTENEGILLSGEHTLKTNLSTLANGIYIYSIQTEKGNTSGRIVVAHQ
ncbi:hypothetical protein BH09BAC5_BH09BAC5_02160 [soil metagenome]